VARVPGQTYGNTPIAPQSRPNFSAIIQCLWNRRAFPWGFPMLVARRDPPFHSDAGAPLNPNSPLAPRASKLPRFVMFMQLFGSLVAVLVGIGSGYSFYRANFSPEATCQTLRSSIIALLDKSVDAAARRVLVRRDIETFERTCAAVDPEATAAFKSLLAAEKTAAPPPSPAIAAPAAPTVPPAAPKAQRSEPAQAQRSEPAPKEPVRKPEPRPQVTAKQPPANTTPAAQEPARRDAPVSDAQWLEAVRQALVTQKPDRRPVEAARPSVVAPVARPVTQEPPVQPPADVRPVARPVTQETPLQPPADVRPNPATPAVAPALPRPITIPPAAAQRVDADHPVPPESIPDAAPPASASKAKPDEPDRSRIGKWISGIPLLGPALDNGRR
jgi:hypothetical protein